MVTVEQLSRLSGNETPLIHQLVPAMNTIFPIWEIVELRLAHFLAQFCHETSRFRTLEEYATGDAYEGREDLGNTQPGDGRRYKGRGGFQTTGRGNYAALQNALGVPVLANPSMLSDIPALGVMSSCIYWAHNRLARYADADNAVALGRAINRGNGESGKKANGEDDRLGLTARAKAIFLDGVAIGTTAELQSAMNDLGFGPLDVDGKFGPRTEGAVKRFQKANHLLVTGKSDLATWRAIKEKQS
jgi:putative chitinase